jgi:aryl-alcohol dehydrogenase-like predicted oxidoreductase
MTPSRPLPAVGKSVYPLGIACNYGIDEAGLAASLERGVNYLYWAAPNFRNNKARKALRTALKRDRERMVVAASTGLAYFGGSVRRACDAALKSLETDYLDVMQLGWLGTTSAWTKGTVEQLVALKRDGKVKAIGVSIHDRPRAGRLAEDSPLDLLMIRYNAAHPGAEKDIFPHLEKRKPAVVAYTATSWRKLLRAPVGWQGPVMTAGDCYRWALDNPHVDVVLSGPASEQQALENIAAVERGPLTKEEAGWMREFGRAVHG